MQRDADADPVLRAARAARLAEAGGRRPSVELLFHALLPERFVLHTHPVLLNAVTCAADGAALAERLFGDRAVWVPYADPGLPLARSIAEARRAFGERTGRPAPAVVLMQNHGVIVTADSAAEIEALYAWLVSVVQGRRRRHRRPPRPRRRPWTRRVPGPSSMRSGRRSAASSPAARPSRSSPSTAPRPRRPSRPRPPGAPSSWAGR